MLAEGRLLSTCETCQVCPPPVPLDPPPPPHQIARPVRSKHCPMPSCGVCYNKFDHHCVWMNTSPPPPCSRPFSCIAAANHRFFVLSIFLCALNAFAGLAFSLPGTIPSPPPPTSSIPSRWRSPHLLPLWTPRRRVHARV
jgi:hypothetical protein